MHSAITMQDMDFEHYWVGGPLSKSINCSVCTIHWKVANCTGVNIKNQAVVTYLRTHTNRHDQIHNYYNPVTHIHTHNLTRRNKKTCDCSIVWQLLTLPMYCWHTKCSPLLTSCVCMMITASSSIIIHQYTFTYLGVAKQKYSFPLATTPWLSNKHLVFLLLKVSLQISKAAIFFSQQVAVTRCYPGNYHYQ